MRSYFYLSYRFPRGQSPGTHTPVPGHICPDSPTFLHTSPPLLWHRRGSSRTRPSWLHLYTGASAPVERSSVPVHTVDSGEPGAAGLPRGPRPLTPSPLRRHPEERASTLLSNLMRWEKISKGFYTHIWPWNNPRATTSTPAGSQSMREGGLNGWILIRS